MQPKRIAVTDGPSPVLESQSGAALASAHPRLHPRLDRTRRGGWDEHCVHDDSRKLAMGEAHRPEDAPPYAGIAAATRGGSTYGGGRGGAAGGTGGGANGDSRDRGWNGTTYCGKWSDAGCGATISGGAGQEAESDDGATDDIRRRADGQRSGGAVGGVVGGNGAAGTGDAGEKEEEAPQADRQTQLPTHPTQTTASYGSGSSGSRTRRGT